MSSTIYKEDAYVLCPYYRKEGPIEIKCAGLCGDHTISVFASKRHKEQFKYDFCNSIYTACPLYQAVEQDEE